MNIPAALMTVLTAATFASITIPEPEPVEEVTVEVAQPESTEVVPEEATKAPLTEHAFDGDDCPPCGRG